jgi:hypothetical protein
MAPRDYLAEKRASAAGHYPAAMIVGCADSRVPTEIVFDAGIGDTSNGRVAGNVVDYDLVGSEDFRKRLDEVHGAQRHNRMDHTTSAEFVAPKESKLIACCCLAILSSLYVVGAMNHGVLRQIVQTLPLWVPIVLGFRGSEFAKWSALPCLTIWLATMVLIWLLGAAWVYVALGQFSLADLALTLIVGAASTAGFVVALRWRTGVRPFSAGAVVLSFGALQFLTLWVSLSLSITRR